ncbi:MAG: hypothetical protein HZB46_06060, partial [Solirubrobacterales bacterium]|nr:hypothetical protein [Solirubrobacterales bacterium]
MTPSVPARLAGRAAGGAFAAVARVRHARPVHPHGPVFAATADLPTVVPGIRALHGRRVPALLRLSRSFDLVSGMPDLLGVAVRLCDLHGPGEHQDLLVVSMLPPPLLVVPAPATSYAHAWYSSLLPYKAGGRAALVAARSRCGPAVREGDALEGAERAAAAGGLAFELALAGPWHGVLPLGRVTAGALLPEDEAAGLAF